MSAAKQIVVDKLEIHQTGVLTQLGQFNAVNSQVKEWIEGIEERTEVKRDEQIAFGLDGVERKGGGLKVTYSAMIEPKRLK